MRVGVKGGGKVFGLEGCGWIPKGRVACADLEGCECNCLIILCGLSQYETQEGILETHSEDGCAASLSGFDKSAFLP